TNRTQASPSGARRSRSSSETEVESIRPSTLQPLPCGRARRHHLTAFSGVTPALGMDRARVQPIGQTVTEGGPGKPTMRLKRYPLDPLPTCSAGRCAKATKLPKPDPSLIRSCPKFPVAAVPCWSRQSLGEVGAKDGLQGEGDQAMFAVV